MLLRPLSRSHLIQYPVKRSPINPFLSLRTFSSSSTWENTLGFVQDHLETFHTITGLPWWATLTLTAWGLRATLAPITIYGLLAQQRMERCTPALRKMYTCSQKAQGWGYISKPSWTTRMNANVLMLKGVRAIWKKSSTNPIKMILSPLLHLPILLTVGNTIRHIVNTNDDVGSFFWIPELSSADPVGILPCVAIALVYTNLEVSFQHNTVAWIQQGKGFLQMGSLVLLPFCIHLPSAVLVYWTASSSFALTQTLVLRNSTVKQILGLQSTPTVATPTEAPIMAELMMNDLPTSILKKKNRKKGEI